MIVLEVRQGELMAELTAQAAARGIGDAAVVSLIGAVESFTVSTMPADDATKDVLTTYELPAEMHGTGEFVAGKPHLHVTMAVAGDRAICGHLHEAWVKTWFARVYVVEA